MTNNKQQTAIEWLIEQLRNNENIRWRGTNIIELGEQAKEMEVAGKEMSYADGYAEGYKRALDYMTMPIKNAIQTKEPK